jgi:hypothetical protein
MHDEPKEEKASKAEIDEPRALCPDESFTDFATDKINAKGKVVHLMEEDYRYKMHTILSEFICRKLTAVSTSAL